MYRPVVPANFPMTTAKRPFFEVDELFIDVMHGFKPYGFVSEKIPLTYVGNPAVKWP